MTETKLQAEQLEARNLPSIFGNPWQFATELSMSFAGEGVQYSDQLWGQGAYASRLYSELGGTMAQSVWQEELLRAMFQWTAAANINVGLVADSGAAFGPDGYTGAPVPTIRVGTQSTGSDVIATSLPNHPLAGLYAGSVMLNDVWTFSKGGGNGTYDLFTVAMHEFGNALGIADIDSSALSAMYGHYYGPRTGLNVLDVVAAQALYGARSGDSFEGALGNETRLTASSLSNVSDPAAFGRTRAVANGDVTTGSDADFYKVVTAAGTTSLTVRLGTAGKSLLAGRVDVYNAGGTLLGTATNTSPLQGDTVLTLTGLQAGTEYYVKVSAGRADTFNVGAYQLRVGYNYDPRTETVSDRVQAFGSDYGLNNSIFTASALTPTTGFVTGTHYEWSGRIESVGDTDYYRLTAPLTGGPMTITVQAENVNLSVSATVYNALGGVVSANVLLNWEGGTYRAQVPSSLAAGTYYVQLKVQDPNWSAWSGNYRASVDFSQPLVQAAKQFEGVATASSQITHGIEVQESGTFVFRFSATSTNRSAVDWIEARVYNARGQLVAAWGTDGLSSTDTLTAFLAKGQYVIQIVPYYSIAGSSATLAYSLGLNRLSDPIDPYLPPDPLSPPPPPPPPPPPGQTEGVIIITPPFNPWAP